MLTNNNSHVTAHRLLNKIEITNIHKKNEFGYQYTNSTHAVDNSGTTVIKLLVTPVKAVYYLCINTVSVNLITFTSICFIKDIKNKRENSLFFEHLCSTLSVLQYFVVGFFSLLKKVSARL